MSEENKAVVQRYIEEVYNKGNVDAVDDLFAADFVDHALLGDQGQGAEGVKQIVPSLRRAFPDEQITIEDIFAEADKVVYRWTARGTHKAEIMGVAPTDKQVTVTGISIIRVADGKIVEEWTNRDDLGMMQQLGLVPSE